MDLCDTTAVEPTLIELQSSTTDTSYDISEQRPGSTCTFYVKTTNIIGDSVYAHNISILFAEIPAKQESAPTFLNRSGGNTALALSPFVELSWDPPVDDGGSEILGYILEANNLDTNSGWYEVYDGQSSPLVTQFKL